MKRLHLLPALLATALAACACFGPAESLEVHGTTLVVDAWTVEWGADGGDEPDLYLKACLKEEAVVDGLRCERWIRFHSEDVLAQCFLAEDAVVQGHPMPAGSGLWFDEAGRLKDIWLSRNSVFDGIPCDGGWGKIMVSFHPNGRVRSAFLPEDTVILGVPCLASVFHPIELDAEGRLERCTLAAPFLHEGRSLKRGDELRLRR